MIFSAAANPLNAADVSPSKPLVAKPSPEESKSDSTSAKAKDATQQEQIDKYIQELGDKDYYVRQHAQNELSRMSFEAFDALTAATLNDDLEIASRAKYLLQLMRVEWTAKNDPEDVKKLLKDYERQPDETRLSRMRTLALMPQGKGILALCRLIRFEKSDMLSKNAVIELLQSPSAAEPPKGARTETIRKIFEKSNRTSASWMLAWLKLADDPQAIAQWNKLIEAESVLLQHSPAETSREIVSGLIHYQIAWLKKQGQTQEAMTAMRRLLDLEKGDLETLAELLDWLVQQKAWKLVDELADRFAHNFDTEPILLYILAQAQNEQGNTEKAEETAHKAFGLNAGQEQIHLLNPLKLLDIYRNGLVSREDIQLLNRYLIAQRLSQRGLFSWAKREFEYVIARGGPNDLTTINAQWSLSEMFHDQGEDLAAANVLESMLSKADSKNNVVMAGRIATVLQHFIRKKPADKIIDRTLSEIRARKCFFQASHWEQTGDKDKRRECLENALHEEPGDVDVLIACYRLPDPKPEYRKKITDLIRQTAEDLRTEISADPENPALYNEFAWLVGNTEGDFDEALKYSQKSLELSPDNGGLYDTLARVCYAKGDYESALKNQQKAAELEPHSGQIAKQLELFKKAQEEHRK
jgi:tetratricopeptide (TPR) repeat protein